MASVKKKIELSLDHPFRSEKAKERFLRLYQQGAEKWPVPSTTRVVETSFGPTFIRVSGPEDAPPLVLLHGVDGNSLQWIPNIAALSKHYRTYAIDGIYDCGLSVYTRFFEGPDDFAGWLDQSFNALELKDKINLVGLSYGGWQAIHYALRFPDRLAKIVLLAPAGTVLPIRLEWITRAALCAIPHRYFTRSFIYWLLEDAARKDEATRKMVAEWTEFSYVAMRSFKARRLVNPAVLTDAELRSLKVPALFLVGENEKIYAAQQAIQRLNKVAPQIRTELIPGAGHDLIARAEIVNMKILEVLHQSR
jgi:pimeloyl-ACP methyl ester carboxylesterase